MIFGRQPMGQTVAQEGTPLPSTQGRQSGAFWLFAMLFVLVPFGVLSAGCGGSSSSNPPASEQTRNAKVSGQVVDQYNSSSPVAGITVKINGIAAVTAQDGTFVIAVPTGQAGNLTVQSPTNARYYSTGYALGQAINLRDVGVPVPALTANQTYSVGTISILSEAGPPPPPIF